jgi:multidrug efflux pump subunit AcrA (membrane-fusion protein)
MNSFPRLLRTVPIFLKKYPYWSAIVLLVILSVLFYSFSGRGTSTETISVNRDTITQEVSVTGKTKPSENVDLAFDRGGRVVWISAQVGDHVTPGQVLAQTDTSDLSAQLKEALGGLASQQAKLDELIRGSRPEDIQIKQTQLNKAKQDLANYYSSVADSLNDAYSKAEDAVRKQTYDMFTNPEDANAQLSFTTNNSQARIDAESQRAIANQMLIIWKNELLGITAFSAQTDLDDALAKAQLRLTTARTFINRLNDALVNQTGLPSATVTTYKANVTTARSNINTALSEINSLAQNISSQKIVVATSQSQLDLEKAGSTPETIKAQSAQVTQAQGSVDAIRARIAQSYIRSPINGIVTKQDAKLGEIATAGNALISVISSSNLQIESNVPEVDIGKLAVANSVNITLDAFPGETFSGHVVAIDPAETIVDGVVNYKITVSFDEVNQKIKSGLTANLRIITQKKEGVLVLPQYAILENDNGSFVRMYDDAQQTTTDVPVVLGIRSSNGTVEIISGVTEGQRVANIGAKIK